MYVLVIVLHKAHKTVTVAWMLSGCCNKNHYLELSWNNETQAGADLSVPGSCIIKYPVTCSHKQRYSLLLFKSPLKRYRMSIKINNLTWRGFILFQLSLHIINSLRWATGEIMDSCLCNASFIFVLRHQFVDVFSFLSVNFCQNKYFLSKRMWKFYFCLFLLFSCQSV